MLVADFPWFARRKKNATFDLVDKKKNFIYNDKQQIDEALCITCPFAFILKKTTFEFLIRGDHMLIKLIDHPFYILSFYLYNNIFSSTLNNSKLI